MKFIDRKFIDTVEEFWVSEDWVGATVPVGENAVTQFGKEFSEFLGAADYLAAPCSTGEEALVWAFQVAFSNTQRRKVLVCGFNCGVVFRAVKSAGGETIKFDRPSPENYSDVLKDLIIETQPAVLVVTHFFGAPEDFTELIEFANSQGVFLVEDCAHCLAGEIGSHTAGTIADASIFSFNYDKPISLLGGGMLLLARRHEHRLAEVGYARGGLHVDRAKYEKISIILMKFWLRMRRNTIGARGLANRVLMKLIGKRLIAFNRKVPLGQNRAYLGLKLLFHYRQVLETRCRNESKLDVRGDARTWPHAETVKPAWLKQKVGPFDTKAVARIELAARNLQMRVGNYNWPESCVTDLAYNQENIKYSMNWIDVPVHQNLTSLNIQEINRLLNDV